MKRSPYLLALLLASGCLQAASTTAWEMNTYQDFLKGRFSGISLSRDGRLLLAPKLETIFSSDQHAIWSVAQATDGTLYLGTGHHGRVYRVDKTGKSEIVWTADEPEVFAVAVDRKGVLYAATSPNGKVYRIENDKATEYFSPGALYIWSLAFAEDGALFVGAGNEGKIYRVTAPGKGEVYYETGQSHITCLAFDAAGRLLAGTDPNGILYRISAKDKAFVLYDANLPEIRTVIAMSDGTVYAAALGGSVAKRTAAAAAAPLAPATVTGTATSITVTAAQGGVEIKPTGGEATLSAPVPTAPALPAVEFTGVEKSAIYKIHPDHTVETLWSSTEENAYGLLAGDQKILFSTDKQGRIYELGPDRKLTLLTQTNEAEAIRLLRSGKALLAATGNMGKIYRLGEGYGGSGIYEAPAHDAGSVARWGSLSWRVEEARGCRVAFRTRSGNSARPDRTWSEWSEPLTDSEGSPIGSPNARYIQWKAALAGSGGRTAAVESVTLAYLPQNTPPNVLSINVSTKSVPANQAKSAIQPASTAAYSITVTDTGEAGASTVTGTSTQRLTRAGAEQIQIAWYAEDSDGDRLIYSLAFRGEGEREWKLIESELEESTYELDSDVLADGKYFFRVNASDRLVNPPASARESGLVSAPVLIDHTPPVVTAGAPKRTGATIEVDLEARDAASALRRCEYSLDAGTWTPLAPNDGIIDSRREQFRLRLEGVSPGEHLLVFRVYDSTNNAGLTKLVLR